MATFRVLGPLAVVVDDGPVEVGGPRLRRMLAALLMQPGRVVSVDRLVEAVFAGRPTPSAGATLRSYATRLRRNLGPVGPDLLVREGVGYRLAVPAQDVDAHQFEATVTAARQHADYADLPGAADQVARALALWRGGAYEEFQDELWAQPEAHRLEEERRAAQEMLIDLQASLGNSATVVGSLRRLLAAEPYREGLVGRLMQAQYRGGRPVDALETYSAFRSRAADELGIDPGPELVDLHQRILARDPQLSSPAERLLRGYRLGERLGVGRLGTVFAATQAGVARTYAIRVYDHEFADDPRVVRSFESDVRAVAGIDHPALLPLYDAWREPGGAALVMRRMPGGTLQDRIDGPGLGPDEARHALTRVAGAVLALARRGRVHGRIRPSSVLLDGSGEAFLSEPALGVPAPETPFDAADLVELARTCLASAAGATGPVPTWLDELAATPGLDVPTAVSGLLAGLQAAPPRPENPYVGLRAFDVGDADRFFGRDDLIEQVRVRIESRGPHPRMVLLVGGSGSGKSSVVRAGVLPALDRGGDGWSTTVMVPGSDPFRNLDAALARIRTKDDGPAWPTGAQGLAEAVANSRRKPILLVIDQLEELFTLAPRADRDRFLDAVAAAVTAEGARLQVVATLRADYFDRPLDHPRFGALAGLTALPVPTMTPTQLELTITGPAEGRLAIEEGLVADLVAATAKEPAALPPLQFALRLLAERGGSVLRRSDLQGLGGVEGAIAQRAEELYSTLGEQQRRLLRWVLTRLVVIGAEGGAARTRVVRADLVGQSDDGPAVDALIESWIAGRLLVGNRRPDTREPTVELAHEAILERWPRLGSWIDQDRERLLAVARLDDAAAQWRDVDRDPAALLRGARLEHAEETRRRSGRLAPLAAEFLDRSVDHRAEQEQVEAAAAMRRESTARRLRRQRVLLAAALVLALAIGGIAIDQRNSATRLAAQTEQRARTAGSALAAASAEAIRSDWSVGLLLAAQAHQIDPSEASRQALIRAVVDPGPVPTTVFVGDRRYRTVEVDPVTGTIAARSTSGTVDLIDPVARQREAVIQALGSGGVAIHDGRVIVANRGDTRGSLIGYDEGQRSVVAQLPRGTYPTDIEFSPSAGQLAVGDSGGSVTIYDPATWAVTHLLGAGSQAPVEQVAWDEAGDTLYALDARAELMVWSGLGNRAPGAGPIAPDRTRNLNDGDAAWVPDYPLRRTSGFSFAELEPIPTTPLLVAAPVDGAPWAIDTRDLGTYFLSGGSSDWVRPAQVAVGPDSPVVYRADGSTWAASPELSLIADAVAGGEEQPAAGGGTRTRWDAVDIAVTTLGTVVTVGSDGNVTLWELPGPVTGTNPVPTLDAAQGIAFSPRGDVLVHWGPGAAATRIDARGYAGSRQLSSGDPGQQRVLGVAFQPELDRILLASCSGADPRPSEPCPGMLAAFDMTTGSLVAGPMDMGPQLGGPGSPVVAGPPLGDVATADAAGSITLRDPTTLEPTRTLADLAGRLLSRVQVSLHLHPDRPLLLADPDKASGIVVWDLGPADPVVAFESSEAQEALFAPDGSLLVAEGLLGVPEREMQIIDTSTFAVLAEVGTGPGLLGQPSSASAGLMLTTDRVGSPWLWNTSEHRPMTTVRADRAALRPDGSALLLWRGDRAHELSLADDDLLATACAAAGRNLTQQEWDRYLGADEPYRTTCPDHSSLAAS